MCDYMIHGAKVVINSIEEYHKYYNVEFQKEGYITLGYQYINDICHYLFKKYPHLSIQEMINQNILSSFIPKNMTKIKIRAENFMIPYLIPDSCTHLDIDTEAIDNNWIEPNSLPNSIELIKFPNAMIPIGIIPYSVKVIFLYHMQDVPKEYINIPSTVEMVVTFTEEYIKDTPEFNERFNVYEPMGPKKAE